MLKIEAGKRYLRADGGITMKLEVGGQKHYPFVESGRGIGGCAYNKKGELLSVCSTNKNLVAEIPEPLIEKFIKDILEYYKEEPEENHYLLF